MVIRMRKSAVAKGGGLKVRRLSQMMAAQPEILDYARHVSERFDLRRDIQFETRAESAVYDDGGWTVTTDGGEVFMPLADYGFSTRFGWVGDRHGVTWQLNLP